MLTAEKVLSTVRSTAEKVCNDETAIVGTMSLGDVVRHGDLYVIAVGSIPTGAKPTKDRQLVPGDTQGSRHTLLGECSVFTVDADQVMEALYKVYGHKLTLFPQLIGPMFRCVQLVELDHPEHGNRILPAGCYATVYQRVFADEIRRVQD